ncbi:hypothetical protein ACFL96_18410, partial [Thermoproteota archaeon]
MTIDVVSAACCIYPANVGGGCDSLIDQITCQAGGGTYFQTDCSLQEVCDLGCCCNPVNNLYTFRNYCDFLTSSTFFNLYAFNPAQTPDFYYYDCNVFCGDQVCTADQTFTCPDDTQIITAECVDGFFVPTEGECEEGVVPVVPPVTPSPPGYVQCNDTLDNDDDGLIDYLEDLGCDSPEDDDETDIVPVTPPPAIEEYCGDGYCSLEENSDNCVLDCGVCGDGIVFNEECENDLDCIAGTCSDCDCVYSCVDDLTSPSSLLASKIPQEKAIGLSWNINTQCEVDSVFIYRCNDPSANTCGPSNLIGTVGEQQVVYSYKDEKDIKDNTTYCYKVSAYYKKTGKDVVSDIACVRTGTKQCMDANTHFCENNIIYQCDEKNNKSAIKNCSEIQSTIGTYQCMGPDENGNAECIFQNNCNLCNDLLGLFGIYGSTLHVVVSPDGSTEQNVACTFEDQIKSCYYDSTKTSVDKYQSCIDIDSCYGYRSEKACEKNTCNFGECEWVDSTETGAEFGIGVCRPVDENKQNCTLCDSDVSESRNLLFGSCSAGLCKLYGECYQKLSPWLMCSPRDGFGWRSYKTQTDCINTDGTSPREVDVDVYYDTNGKRIRGTNVIVTRSNDYGDLGTCKWRGGVTGCVKDADGNNKADCGPQDASCHSDNTPPVTTIIPDHVTENGKILLGKEVHIKLKTDEPATTYFCFAPEGDFCYPNETTGCGVQKKANFSGDYKMHYYSEDWAHNLEELKSVKVEFDNTVPIVTENTRIMRNRTFMINLTTDSEVVCTGHLEDDRGIPVYPDVRINEEKVLAGGKIERIYVGLPDNNYYFIYECKDKFGNRMFNQIYFVIDNNRIINPSPVGPVKRTAIPMSVKTKSKAECRYSRSIGTNIEFEKMTERFLTNDGLNHTTTAFGIGGEYYAYDIKCNFSDPWGNTIEGEENDRIRFAIDDKPPTLAPISTYQAYFFDQSTTFWSKQTIMIKCSDNWMQTNKNIKNMDFGCNQTEYNYTDWITQQAVLGSFKEEGPSDPFTVNTTQMIRYTTTDKGGNKGDGLISVKVDTTPPIIKLELFKAPLSDVAKKLEQVSYGDYILRVTSTKSLSSVEAKGIVFVTPLLNVPLTLIQSTNFRKTHYFAFSIPWDLPAIQNKSMIINITAKVGRAGDPCSAIPTSVTNKYYAQANYTFDTTMPVAEIKPPLNTYKALNYPLNTNGTVYFTNENPLFVTGIRKTGTDVVNFYSGTEKKDIKVCDTYDFTQNANPTPIITLTAFDGSIGDQYMYNYMGSLSSLQIVPGNYLEFKDKRRKYRYFDSYYGIKKVSGSQIT